jgi:hypothetical protein
MRSRERETQLRVVAKKLSRFEVRLENYDSARPPLPLRQLLLSKEYLSVESRRPISKLFTYAF